MYGRLGHIQVGSVRRIRGENPTVRMPARSEERAESWPGFPFASKVCERTWKKTSIVIYRTAIPHLVVQRRATHLTFQTTGGAPPVSKHSTGGRGTHANARKAIA